jgi:NAD(P)-dependent dehydrogenase (short-subunit alcohol dehydrogenase family)
MTNSARRDGPAVDPRHLLVIGAGPGLGGGIAHRFAQGGYHVNVVGAIVATQVAAPAMRAAGGRTILFTGGGWADHPGPAWATVSLGKAALRPAATMLGADLAHDGIRVASITIAGQIRPGTPFSPDQIAEKYWSVVQSDGTWHSEFRFDGT